MDEIFNFVALTYYFYYRCKYLKENVEPFWGRNSYIFFLEEVKFLGLNIDFHTAMKSRKKNELEIRNNKRHQ